MLIDLTYAKAYLGISGTSYDTLLTDLIGAASKAVEGYCRRPFEAASYTEYLDGNADTVLQVSKVPVTSLTSVTIGPNEATPEVIAGSDFVLDQATGQIKLKPTSTATPYFPRGFRNVKVIYAAGFATIPDDVKLACAMIVSNAYNLHAKDNTLAAESLGDYSYQQRAGVTSSIMLPTEVKGLLDKYRDWTF